VADTIRIGLDGFVRDALGSQALQERVETGDGEGDPAVPAPTAFGSMKRVACSLMSQRASSPARASGGRPKNRVYQSTAAPSSETGTPAMR